MVAPGGLPDSARSSREVIRKGTGDESPTEITERTVADMLGAPPHADEVLPERMRRGVALGLSWTPVGGNVLFVEAPPDARHGRPGRPPGQSSPVVDALQLRAGECGSGDAAAGLLRAGKPGVVQAPREGRKRHDVPAHHRAAAALDEYVEAGDLEGAADGGAVPERGPGGAPADGPGVAAPGRPGDNQAPCRSRGAPALDVLPHVPGDGGSRRICRTAELSSTRRRSRGTRRPRRRSSTTGRRTR